jgi:hypothetical protein
LNFGVRLDELGEVWSVEYQLMEEDDSHVAE